MKKVIINQKQQNAKVVDGTKVVSLGAGQEYVCGTSELPNAYVAVVDTTIESFTPQDTIRFRINDANFLIDFGDGTGLHHHTTGTIEHQYDEGGEKTIKMYGYGSPLWYHSASDRHKLKKVLSFGSGWINTFNSSFTLCTNLESLPMNEHKFCGYDMRQAFHTCPLSEYPILNTSRVVTMGSAFMNSNFDDKKAKDWILISCSDMNAFYGTYMSRSTTDALLLGWLRWENGQPGIQLKENVPLHLGNTCYTLGGEVEEAFNYYVDVLNWTITISWTENNN